MADLGLRAGAGQQRDRRGRVVVCNAPIVEGAVMAATEASGGSTLETVRRTAEEFSPQ